MKIAQSREITNPVLGPDLQAKTGLAFFQSVIPSLVGWGFVIGTLLFVLYFILGAIGWITSGGDKASVEAARDKITQALIGLVILFSLFAIIKVIEYFFCINILTIDIGPLKIESAGGGGTRCIPGGDGTGGGGGGRPYLQL